MIRALFLPDQLFAKHILSLEFGKTQVLACQSVQKAGIAKIEQLVSANLDLNNEKTHEEQLLDALNQILNQIKIKSDCEVRIVLPNNQVFFKELTVPFVDRNKIKMILGYEIESNLPFPLHEAFFDFIITKQDLQKQESSIVVAITQKKQLNFYLDLIKQTTLKISTVTVDLIALFGLYSRLYENQLEKYQVLLDLGKTSLTISYLWQGKIWLVRNLPYGINQIVSKIASSSKKPTKDVLENLFRFGLDQDSEHDFKAFFEKMFNDLSFTLNSFQTQASITSSPKILVVESAIEIKNIAQVLSEKLKLDCHLLELNKFGANKHLNIAQHISVSPNNLICLSAAINATAVAEFNLLPNNAQDRSLLRNQIVTAFILTLLFFVMIYGLGYFKNRQLTNTLNKYQKETVDKLKEKFSLNSSSLSDAIAKARLNIEREKKLWFSFSNQTRYSVLKYLQVLSNAVDVKKINLDLKKLIINDDSMTIKGSVENFDDLYPFEQALINIPVFKSVTKPQERDFTINITLKQNDGDAA